MGKAHGGVLTAPWWHRTAPGPWLKAGPALFVNIRLGDVGTEEGDAWTLRSGERDSVRPQSLGNAP